MRLPEVDVVRTGQARFACLKRVHECNLMAVFANAAAPRGSDDAWQQEDAKNCIFRPDMMRTWLERPGLLRLGDLYGCGIPTTRSVCNKITTQSTNLAAPVINGDMRDGSCVTSHLSYLSVGAALP